MLFLTTDDLLGRRVETVRRVLDFLGVSAETSLCLEFEAHRSSEKLEKNRALTLAMKFRYRRLVPRPIRRGVRRLLASPVDPSTFRVDDETREFLKRQLAPEVRRLSEMTGEDFGRVWSIES
jgi:hypothetical protein